MVHARRSRLGSVDLTEWREIELELEGAGNEALLDALSERLLGAGLQRGDARSKLHRVLGDDVRPAVPETGSKAADCLLGYAAEQVEAIVSGDARVRVDDDEAVHDMRVGTRRLRSHLATFRPFFDQRRTERLRDELKWLGQELGRLRDSEVLRERLQAIVDEEPPELVLGPVADRVTIDMSAAQRDAREAVLATLDSDRYVDLLEDLHELIDDPPWAPDRDATTKGLRTRVAHAFERMDDRAGAIVDEPLAEHVTGLHDLRKAAKRARYAAESVAPLFGKRRDARPRPGPRRCRTCSASTRTASSRRTRSAASACPPTSRARTASPSASCSAGSAVGRQRPTSGTARSTVGRRRRRSAAGSRPEPPSTAGEPTWSRSRSGGASSANASRWPTCWRG